MDKLLTAFPVFKLRDYRLYFFGQLISLVGTWLQLVAEQWLVLGLTNSAFWVGVVAALGFLPVLLFGLFGGVIVDRFHTRHLLLFTNSGAMILALTLGILVITGHVTVPIICVMAFLLGIVNSIDMPARQAFTIEIVGREYLSSAIALNMGMFNSSRVIGPALAGVLIAAFGIGPAYIINGLSFIAAIVALLIMKVQSDLPEVHPHPLDAIKEGLIYTKNHKLIRNLVIFMVFFSIFGFSYGTILPFIAKNVYGKDSSGLGIMYAASGIGALIGTFIVYPISKKFDEIKLIAAGTFTFLVALVLFSITTNFYIALVLLAIQGIAMSFPWAMIMSSVQRHVENSVRGRVSSITTLAMLGMQPIGSLQIGFLAEKFGPAFALQFGAFMVFLATLFLIYSLRPQKAHAV
jgi:MFS family permease